MARHEIKLKIQEEADLFSPYDPDQNLLADEVITVLMRNYINKHRRIKEDFTLHIISDTPVDEERVKQKCRNYFAQEKEDTDYHIRKLTTKAVLLALFGAAVLMLWVFLAGLDSVRGEILCIIGWVGVWEATDIFIMERPELVRTRYHLSKLIDSEVLFTQTATPAADD